MSVHSASTADRADELDQRLGVPDARDVRERDALLGEQRGSDDRKGGVLVPARLDGTGEGKAAFHDVLDGGHWGVGAGSAKHARCDGVSSSRRLTSVFDGWYDAESADARDGRHPFRTERTS